MNNQTRIALGRTWAVSALVFAALVLLCWGFPQVWYTRTDPPDAQFWFGEHTNLTGWAYRHTALAKSAESTLVADVLMNGEFSQTEREPVRVFSARRTKENQNEIGLFVHTPDRCWTEAGWKLDPVSPDVLQWTVAGTQIQFERRVFGLGDQRELVYFAGLVGGRPLPYRLDHNLSVGMRYQLRQANAARGTALRASDNRLWARVWDAFTSRRPLLGPKQFLRVSTPILAGDLSRAEARLQKFLHAWLKPEKDETGS